MRGALYVIFCVIVACDQEDIAVPLSDDGVSVISIGNADPPAGSITETARVDGASPDLSLSYVAAVEADSAHLYVLDRTLAQVIVVESQGRVVSRIGRNGDGPAEFRDPTFMAMHMDTLFILDRHGINRFLTNGTYLGRAPINAQPAGGTTRYTPYPQSLSYGDGGLVTSFHKMVPGPRRSPYADTLTLHRLSASGELSPPVERVVTEQLYALGAGAEAPPHFMTRTQFTVAPNGPVYIARQDGVTIDEVNLRTSAVRRLRFDVERLEVSSSALDSLYDLAERSSREIFADDPVAAREYTRALRDHKHARYRSVTGSIVAGANGILLVKRLDLSPIGDRIGEVATWDIIRADGTNITRLLLPSPYKPKRVDATRIIGVSLDSLNVPSIVGYEWRSDID